MLSLLSNFKLNFFSPIHTQPLHGNVPEELYNSPQKDRKRSNQPIDLYNNYNNHQHEQDRGHQGYDNFNNYNPYNHGQDQRGIHYMNQYDQNNNGYYNVYNPRYNPGLDNQFKRQKMEIIEMSNYHPKLKTAIKVLRGRG